MSRSLAIGAAALGLIWWYSDREDSGKFRYDVGGAARSIIAGQVAMGFHPCGIGWAVQRTKGGRYTVRLWSLDGNNLIPSGGGLKPLRVRPDDASPAAIYNFIAPGMQGYTNELPIIEFDDVVSAGNSVSASASMLIRENGGTVEEATKCVETPAVARTGKISSSGVTSLENWIQAGGEDLQ